MYSTFPIVWFFSGGRFNKLEIVSSMLSFREKRFSVVPFQQHVSWTGLTRPCAGVVVCVMFCVSYIFYFPRVYVQDDDLWWAGSTVLTTSYDQAKSIYNDDLFIEYTLWILYSFSTHSKMKLTDGFISR